MGFCFWRGRARLRVPFSCSLSFFWNFSSWKKVVCIGGETIHHLLKSPFPRFLRRRIQFAYACYGSLSRVPGFAPRCLGPFTRGLVHGEKTLSKLNLWGPKRRQEGK